MVKPAQVAFSYGELSPELYARTDLATYAQGLRTLQNWFVRYTGGISNRPGTQFITEIKDSSTGAYLIPFRFSRSVSYVLELGDLYMRIIKNGAQVTSGGSPVEIVSPYAVADLADLRYTQSADVMTLFHPSYPPYQLKRTSDTAWTFEQFFPLDGPYKDINTDESIVVWASADTGTVTLSASSAIFTANHVGALFYLEAQNLADVLPWEPDKQIAPPSGNPNGQVRRNSIGDVYQCVTSVTAGTEEIRTGTVEPTHKSGIASDGDGSPITNTASTTLAEQAGVAWQYLYSFYGRLQITGYTDAQTVTAEVIGRLPVEVVSASTGVTVLSGAAGDGSTTVFDFTAASTSDVSSDYVVTKTTIYSGGDFHDITHTNTVSPDKYTVDHTAGTSGDGQITLSVAPTSDQTIKVVELVGGNTTNIWALGAWSTEEGFPSCGCYFADRLTIAGTTGQPQTVSMSKAGNYASFAESFPTAADDAIVFTLNAREINPINEMLPLDHLILLTQGAEWRMTTGAEELVTPTSIGVRVQSNFGSANRRAEIIGDSAVYVESQGGRVRGMSFDGQLGRYTSRDLGIMSSHLFDGHTLRDLSYHRAPYRILWAVRSDGVLLSFTYMAEQNVTGWARHTTGDTAGDTFERACVVPEGDEDALYVLVKRTINGATKRYIERLHTRTFSSVADAWFVDSGLSFDGTNTNAAYLMKLTGSTWTKGGGLTLTASGGHTPFASTNVGEEVDLNAGTDTVRVQITSYTSTTSVSVVALGDVPASLQAITTSDWVFRKKLFSGLDHLEGRTVASLIDGNVGDQVVVSGGSVTLSANGAKVVVGLPIENAAFETLNVNFPGAETVTDRLKTIPKVSLIVKDTRGLQAGETSTAEPFGVQARSTEAYGDPAALKTDTEELYINATWNKSGRVYVQQPDPLPATVLGIVPTVEVGGSSG